MKMRFEPEDAEATTVESSDDSSTGEAAAED